MIAIIIPIFLKIISYLFGKRMPRFIRGNLEIISGIFLIYIIVRVLI